MEWLSAPQAVRLIIACISFAVAVLAVMNAARAKKNAEEAAEEAHRNVENWAEIRRLCKELREGIERAEERLANERRNDDTDDGNGDCDHRNDE